MSTGQIIENALAAGIAAAFLYGIFQMINKRKPEFFWKLKPKARIGITFVAALVFFAILAY